MSEIVGVQANGVRISIQPMPGRKRKYICIEEEGRNVLWGVAPITGKDREEAFLGALAMFAGVEVGDSNA